MKDWFKRTLDDTPKKGRKVAAVGVGFGVAGVGAHFGLKFFEPTVLDALPEQHRIIYVMFASLMENLPIILEVVGGFLFFYGASRTKNEDNE